MLICDGKIDLPDELIKSLEERRLAIFVGAGASMAKPSNLPSFMDLTAKIAQEFEHSFDKKQSSLEKFLGKLADENPPKNIHQSACDILKKTEPQPNALHKNIVKLFPQPADIRIVTTNYDNLLEKAIEESKREEVKIYSCPALPLGRDFKGIIHLHGIWDEPENIVITDKDFGQAYLTDNWATRFLKEAFENYDILFVGYSHNDTVMEYLTRALIGEKKSRLYSLIKKDEAGEDKFIGQGIEVISFSGYDELPKIFTEIAEITQKDMMTWKQDITLIAQSPLHQMGTQGERDILGFEIPIIHSMSNKQDEETLKKIIFQDSAKLKLFFKAIEDIPSWLNYLYQQKYLQFLFDENKIDLTDIDREIKDWIVLKAYLQCPKKLLEIFTREKKGINPLFWMSFARDLKKLREENEAWLRWLAFNFPQNIKNIHSAEYYAAYNELTQYAFTQQTQLGVECIKDLFHKLPHFLSDMDLYILQKIQENILENKGDIAHSMIEICAQFLEKHRLYHRNSYEPYYFHRSSIDPHEQDRYPETVDFIIDILRDNLLHLAQEDQDYIKSWVSRYQASENIMLKRFSIYLLYKTIIYPKTYIFSLIKNMDIDDTTIHHEIFHLMKKFYPLFSDREKRAFIKKIKSLTREKENYQYYAHYNWFIWLQEADETCPLLQKELLDIKGKYPDFEPREYLDLTFWISDVKHPPSPYSYEQILQMKTDEQLHQLIRFYDGNHQGDFEKSEAAHQLSSEISIACQSDFSWRVTLGNYLIENKLYKHQSWNAVIGYGLSWPDKNEEIKELVNILNHEKLLLSHPKDISYLLRNLFSQKDPILDIDIINQSEKIITYIWENIDLSSPVTSEGEPLLLAINSTEGHIADYWLSHISYVKEHYAKDFSDYKEVLEKLMDIHKPKSIYTIPIFARNILYLFTQDNTWAQTYLIPLFDSQNEKIFKAAWNGYLHNPRINSKLYYALKDIIFANIDKILVWGNNDTKDFLRLLASIFLYIEEQPHTELIPKLLNPLNDEQIAFFTREMAFLMKDMQPDQIKSVGENWLLAYLKNRLANKPKPLNGKEISAWIELAFSARPLFTSIVNQIIQMPKIELPGSIYEINKLQWQPEEYEILAKLIIYILSCSFPNYNHYHGQLLKSFCKNEEFKQNISKEIQQELKNKFLEQGF